MKPINSQEHCIENWGLGGMIRKPSVSVIWEFWLDSYQPEIEDLREALFEQLFASLPDASQKADELLNSFEGKVFPDEYGDYATESAAELYDRLTSVRQAVLNMATVMLWHLLEQQVLSLYRLQLVYLPKLNEFQASTGSNKHQNPRYFCDVKDQLIHVGIDVETLPSYKKLDELRLVANSVKHGKGNAAEQLFEQRADLFAHPDSSVKGGTVSPQPEDIERPAAGNGIYVTIEDLAGYFDVAVSFWNEFGKMIERCNCPENE
tara:strand:+ start:779 stop:1567 length:789 start_codon:yes stop_codon:yes gene_type:complete